jgi:hypothetical protein
VVGFLGGGRALGLVPERGHQPCQALPDVRFIVDDQDARARGSERDTGSVMMEFRVNLNMPMLLCS